jgi:hypothetical protein
MTLRRATHRPLPRALALLLGLALTAAALVATAQTPAQAKRFAAAQSLYDQGSFVSAMEEFKSLATETGSPNAEVYAARCLRELGRLPEAYEAMTLALRHATTKAEAEPKYASTRNAAAAELALLEPKVGKLLVAVANPPAGLKVTVNGAPLAPEKLGVAVPAATGEVVVRFVAPGRTDVERRVTLRGGEPTTLTVALDAAPAAAPGPPPPKDAPPPEPAAPTRGGGGRIAGFVVIGVGVAGMATFAGAGVTANSHFSSINAACGGKRCTDPSFASQIDGGKKLDLAADVGLGVGIAGLVAGGLLVALGGPRPARDTPHVTAWATPGSGGLALGGAFY